MTYDGKTMRGYSSIARLKFSAKCFIFWRGGGIIDVKYGSQKNFSHISLGHAGSNESFASVNKT